jgi:transmembrane sensor
MDIPSHIAALMARVLSGNASAEDQQELKEYLLSNPEALEQLDNLRKIWEPNTGAGNKGSDEKLHRLLKRAKTIQAVIPAVPEVSTESGEEETVLFVRPVVPLWKRMMKYAAILVFIAGVAFAVKWISGTQKETSLAEDEQEAEHKIVASNGSRTRAMLPDGTKLWLNAGSSISYKNDFGTQDREVVLHGEAFFDVTRDTLHPFIVHAGDIDVRVLGTVFNVKSYEGDQYMETTLLHGAVEVTTRHDKNSKVLLKPHQKLIIPVNSRPGDTAKTVAKERVSMNKYRFRLEELNTKSEAKTLVETAWVFNRLEFRNETLEAIAGKFKRWFNVEVVFEDEAVKQLVFTASFENETIEEAIAALQHVTPFRYKKTANEIRILSAE